MVPTATPLTIPVTAPAVTARTAALFTLRGGRLGRFRLILNKADVRLGGAIHVVAVV